MLAGPDLLLLLLQAEVSALEAQLAELQSGRREGPEGAAASQLPFEQLLEELEG